MSRSRSALVYRSALAAAAVSFGAIFVHALLGPAGLVTAALACGIRLALPLELILRWHPRFRTARVPFPAESAILVPTVAELSRRCGLDPPPRLRIADRCGLNAYALATPAGAAIVIGREVLSRLDHRERAGVLAHELVHLGQGDSYVGWLWAAARALAVIVVLAGAVLGPQALQGLPEATSPTAVLGLLIAAAAAFVLDRRVHRMLEANADLGAVQLTGDAGALGAALAKHRARLPAGSDATSIDRRIAQLDRLAGRPDRQA